MINSRNLQDLDPEAREICEAQLAECHVNGIELIVTSTWRDMEAQTALYAIGRTIQLERRAVTNAKGGQSWHNYRAAWDVVPVVGGKPIWDATDPLWKEVIRIGKAAGAEAGAEWKTFKDPPHFQIRPTLRDKPIDIAEALNRWNEDGTIFAV